MNHLLEFKTSARMFSLSMLLGLLSLGAFAQQGGIQFFEGTYKEALAEAQRTDKMVFLDAYASWCGPCKQMAAEIFPMRAVGDFYNDNFVCIKMDMEKGEGPKIAKKYNVQFYPTYVFMDMQGKAIHQGAGFKAAEDFILDGQNALDPDMQVFVLQEKYKQNPDDPAIARNLALSAYGAGLTDLMADASETYMNSLSEEDWSRPDAMDFVLKTLSSGYDSKGFKQMVKNHDSFVEAYGQEEVETTLMQVLSYDIAMAARSKDSERLKDLVDFVDSNLPQYSGTLNPQLQMQYYQRTRDWEKYADLATTHLGNGKSTDSWQELNATAWTFHEHVEDAGQLKTALQWAKRSVKLDKNYYNTDTYAALLYKAGKYKKARKLAKMAIALAEKEAMDPKETKELLKNIESKL